MSSKRSLSFFQGPVFVIAGALLTLLLPLFVSRYQQHLFIMIMFFAFAATCWNIVCGFIGQLSLGHAVYLGVGGYVSTLFLVNTGLTPWLGMLIGAVAAALFGLFIGYPALRLQGPYFTLTTIAFGEILRIWIENNERLFGLDIKGSMGLVLPQYGNSLAAFEFESKLAYYYIILAFVFMGILVTYLISRSKLGFYLTAIKSDPDAAASLGIPLARYKMYAMLISTFMIAFAGTFYAQYFRYVGPTRVFGIDLSIQIALIGLVGGQGTVFGPLFGAILLVPVSEFLAERFGGSLPGLNLFIYGIIMILVVFFMPKGINDYIIKGFKWIGKKMVGKVNDASDLTQEVKS
jgi:branched-chain amino acid transport system permease protein